MHIRLLKKLGTAGVPRWPPMVFTSDQSISSRTWRVRC